MPCGLDLRLAIPIRLSWLLPRPASYRGHVDSALLLVKAVSTDTSALESDLDIDILTERHAPASGPHLVDVFLRC